MKYQNYFHETPSTHARKILESYDNYAHKIDVWNAFVNCELDGVSDDDFSILPRLIPASYFPTIEKTCREITEFMMKLLSLPEAEVKAIIPKGPVRDYLINELNVLKLRHPRMTGSFRFDMAVVGKAEASNPPQLLEVNELGFDGLARSSFFQETMLTLMPELRKRVVSLDTAAAEVRNMSRIGDHISRLQYDCYNWDEEYLRLTAIKMGKRLDLVSPTQYKCKIDSDFPLLQKIPFHFVNDKVKVGDDFPSALNMSHAFTTQVFKRDHDLYANILRSKTPLYGPLATTLVASKSILKLLADQTLRKKLMGSPKMLQKAILPAYLLDEHIDEVRTNSADYVIKHADGFGGQQVFMDDEMMVKLKKIPPSKRHEWIVQKKTRLNLLDVNGILSRRKKAISDLGVFVHYDWADGKFRHFEVGGLMCRATNKSLKVNVSSGGLQVAVMLDKGC